MRPSVGVVGSKIVGQEERVELAFVEQFGQVDPIIQTGFGLCLVDRVSPLSMTWDQVTNCTVRLRIAENDQPRMSHAVHVERVEENLLLLLRLAMARCRVLGLLRRRGRRRLLRRHGTSFVTELAATLGFQKDSLGA